MSNASLLAASERYHPLARVLHWAVALLVLVAFPFGAVIKFVKDDVKLTFYMLHESFGFIVLWLMLARIALRLIVPPPPEPPMPAIFARTASVVHVLLYVLLLLMPVTGFLMTNAFGFPLKWFGLFEVWSPIGKNDALAGLFKSAHIAMGWGILVLFVLHMGGVLFHHVIRRDPTLYRII